MDTTTPKYTTYHASVQVKKNIEFTTDVEFNSLESAMKLCTFFTTVTTYFVRPFETSLESVPSHLLTIS